MGEVIDITANKPHLSGPARCLQCQYKWICVAPTGTIVLRCPSCELLKGVWEGLCGAAEGEEILICLCGCDVYYVTRTKILCVMCGAEALP